MDKSYSIIKEMLAQRMYSICASDQANLGMIKAKKPTGDFMVVFFLHKQKINTVQIQNYICQIRDLDINHCIIVYEDTITPVAKKIINETSSYKIELFEMEELQSNITKHYLVPKHSIAYKKGCEGYSEFIKKFGTKFPILLKNDPVAKFYNYGVGDIIKIQRKDGFVIYRIVK